jgi:hypothetical protein
MILLKEELRDDISKLHNSIEGLSMIYGTYELSLAREVKNNSPNPERLEVILIETLDIIFIDSIADFMTTHDQIINDTSPYGIDLCYYGSSLICNTVFESSNMDNTLFKMVNSYGLLDTYSDAISFLHYSLIIEKLHSNWIDRIFNHFEIIYVKKESD